MDRLRIPLFHVFSPPLGLMYIKSYINHVIPQSLTVRLFNFQVPQKPSWGKFKLYLEEFKPDVIGISVMTFFWYDTCQTIKAIRKVVPDALIVGGGPHMWIYPEESLERGGFDIIVQGAGEKIFSEIIVAHIKQDGLNHIKGIFYRKDGKLRRTQPNDEIKDLDNLPFPDRSDDVNVKCKRTLKMNFEVNFKLTALVMASTGCPYKCRYCNNRNRNYRPRRVDCVIEELLECKNMGYHAIRFSDDIFTCSRKHVVSLCEAMLQHNLNMPWGCQTRVDHLDRELIRLMVKAGCVRVQIGVESGNQHILNNMNKNFKLEDCRKVFALCREEGLSTVGYFMIGFPGETKEMAQKTIAFAEEIDADYVVFFPVFPIPGTELFEQAVNDPLYDSDWMRRYILNPTPNLKIKMWLSDMSERDVSAMISRFYRRFYLKPHRVFKYFKELKNFNDLVIKARASLYVLAGK
jgi:anaerobic magnesium-protoporphyrin IX monomethyl ester cyclase